MYKCSIALSPFGMQQWKAAKGPGDKAVTRYSTLQSCKRGAGQTDTVMVYNHSCLHYSIHVICRTGHFHIIPYSWKFSWDKIFTKPSCLCIVVILRDKSFTNAIKVTTSAMQSLTQKKKFVDKIFANESRRAGGEVGENFLVAKISSCTVHIAIWTTDKELQYRRNKCMCL